MWKDLWTVIKSLRPRDVAIAWGISLYLGIAWDFSAQAMTMGSPVDKAVNNGLRWPYVFGLVLADYAGRHGIITTSKGPGFPSLWDERAYREREW